MRDVLRWVYTRTAERVADQGEEGRRRLDELVFGDDPRDWVELEDGTVGQAPSWWREDLYQAGTEMGGSLRDIEVRTVTVGSDNDAWRLITGTDAAVPVTADTAPVIGRTDDGALADVAEAWDWALPPDPVFGGPVTPEPVPEPVTGDPGRADRPVKKPVRRRPRQGGLT